MKALRGIETKLRGLRTRAISFVPGIGLFGHIMHFETIMLCMAKACKALQRYYT